VMSEKMEASNANGLKELRKEDDRGRASKKARWEVPPKAAASYWQAEDSSVEVRCPPPPASLSPPEEPGLPKTFRGDTPPPPSRVNGKTSCTTHEIKALRNPMIEVQKCLPTPTTAW